MGCLYSILNNENEFDNRVYEQQSQLRYFVGKGNNAQVIKTIIKQRANNWAQPGKKKGLEETPLENVNLIWTQIKRQHIVESFESLVKK